MVTYSLFNQNESLPAPALTADGDKWSLACTLDTKGGRKSFDVSLKYLVKDSKPQIILKSGEDTTRFIYSGPKVSHHTNTFLSAPGEGTNVVKPEFPRDDVMVLAVVFQEIDDPSSHRNNAIAIEDTPGLLWQLPRLEMVLRKIPEIPINRITTEDIERTLVDDKLAMELSRVALQLLFDRLKREENKSL